MNRLGALLIVFAMKASGCGSTRCPASRCDDRVYVVIKDFVSTAGSRASVYLAVTLGAKQVYVSFKLMRNGSSWTCSPTEPGRPVDCGVGQGDMSFTMPSFGAGHGEIDAPLVVELEDAGGTFSTKKGTVHLADESPFGEACGTCEMGDLTL